MIPRRAIPCQPVLVATCGNSLAGSDAFGPCVAALLRRRPLPGADLLELSGDPTLLLEHLPARRALLLVDAVHCPPLPPGRLLDVDWFAEELAPSACLTRSITHDLSVIQQLHLAAALGLLPPVVRLLALVITPPRFSCPPPPMIHQRAPCVAARLQAHIRHLHPIFR